MSGTDWAENILSKKKRKKEFKKFALLIVLSNFLTALVVGSFENETPLVAVTKIKKNHVLLKIQAQNLVGKIEKNQKVSLFKEGGERLIKEAYIHSFENKKKSSFQNASQQSFTLEVHSTDLAKIIHSEGKRFILSPFYKSPQEKNYEIKF